MEKEHQPDSMATITMKPEYPPSEVYSASEPPPAYRQRVSNSVQIARIIALTVVAASFISGAFILASTWIAARSSCHQLEQLDAMLDKELALEGRSYGNDALVADEPLPIGNAHALRAAPPAHFPESTAAPAPQPPAPSAESFLKDEPLKHAESKVDEEKLQKLDDEKNESDESSESDSSGEEDDDELIRPMMKLPIQFDLDELAGAFLANSQKGRMNCVVERRREDPSERQFPFNILGAFAPRASQAERIAIICHGGDDRPVRVEPEPASQVFALPLAGPMRLPLRPAPRTRPAPFPLPMPWESSEEQMSPPREMRIHVQRVFAIPAPHNMPAPENMMPFAPPPLPQQQEQNERNVDSDDLTPPRQVRVIAIPAPRDMPRVSEAMGPFAPPPLPSQQQQNAQPAILQQFIPHTAPTQEMEQPEVQKMHMEGRPMSMPWGLTPEDLHMIHRTAQDVVNSQRRDHQMDNDMQEVKTIVNTLAAAAEAEQREAEQREAERREAEQREAEQREAGQHEAEQHEAEQHEAEDRVPEPTDERTLLLPRVEPRAEPRAELRPHYMQPRSVRSADSPLAPEKRVKRCACDCV